MCFMFRTLHLHCLALHYCHWVILDVSFYVMKLMSECTEAGL